MHPYAISEHVLYYFRYVYIKQHKLLSEVLAIDENVKRDVIRQTGGDEDVYRTPGGDEDVYRTPSNVRIVPEEESLEIH